MLRAVSAICGMWGDIVKCCGSDDVVRHAVKRAPASNLASTQRQLLREVARPIPATTASVFREPSHRARCGQLQRLSVLGCWAERLRVDALGGDTIRLEAVLDAGHESRWTAQVVVGVGCLDEIAEEFWADPSLHVVVDPELVPWRWPAVGD